MKMLRIPLLAAAAVLAAAVPAAHAATITSNMSVTATVPAACSFTTAPSAMAFGNYTGAADVDQTSSMTITCGNGLAYKVYTASIARQMITATPVTALSYELHSNAARTAVFPSSSAAALTFTGSGAGQTLTIWGRIPAGQTVNPGSYSHSMTITVEF